MKVAFIGGGNMATAIIGGLVAKGFDPANVVVVEPGDAARARIAADFGANAIAAPDATLAKMDAIVMAVKPQQMREAATALKAHLEDAVVISIAAGIRLADLSRWLGGHARCVRTMPNTPALVHAGVTGLFAAPGVTGDDRRATEQLLGAVGRVLWLEREADLDAVVAVSGSGPAYVFYAIEAVEAAARDLGLSPEQARALTLATFDGATKLAIARGEDPAQLRANVTSKGGTTAAALAVLEAAGVKETFRDAIRAARERSIAMGDEFGKDP